ncbi:MAG TPA: DUF3667 domain-containing protein [Cyclobacteriaceae bacterium]|nr:DUF3667 domain-containing protein [Cyclobacteriaceae bacterium]
MDELGKSFPAAEGMVDAESNTGNKPHPNEFCLNCGTKLEDLYCHHCGQKDIPRRQTLGELFSNFISSFWSYEGKFFLTTKYIFLKPGFLAVEYNKGKRESYFHPARMYVFVSFLFFLLFFSLPDADNDAADAGLSEEEKKELANVVLDSSFVSGDSLRVRQQLSKYGLDSTLKFLDTLKYDNVDKKKKKQLNWSFKDTQYKSIEEYDSVQNTLPEDERDSYTGRMMQKRTIELQKKYGNDANALGKDFLASFSDNFSKVLFYLMPFMALVLKLLYVRRDYFYSEHLVFTIYYYDFFYLAGCLMMIFNLIPGLGFVSVLLGFWIYFYLLFAMKRAYGQSWKKTILKFVLFTGLFSILVLIGVTINALATLMLI